MRSLLMAGISGVTLDFTSLRKHMVITWCLEVSSDPSGRKQTPTDYHQHHNRVVRGIAYLAPSTGRLCRFKPIRAARGAAWRSLDHVLLGTRKWQVILGPRRAAVGLTRWDPQKIKHSLCYACDEQGNIILQSARQWQTVASTSWGSHLLRIPRHHTGGDVPLMKHNNLLSGTVAPEKRNYVAVKF